MGAPFQIRYISVLVKSICLSLKVIKRLTKIGKLGEFQAKIDDMIAMKTLIPLTEKEIEDLKVTPHHLNKLSYTQSRTSASTPLMVLRDSTSKVPNVGGVYSLIAQRLGYRQCSNFHCESWIV